MMRTVRVSGSGNRAVLDDATGVLDLFGDPGRREFWAPSDGGYVREIDEAHPGTLGQQVCDRLAHTGTTLYWSPGGRSVADIVRRWIARHEGSRS